jgi:hypothetical protein
MDHVEDYMYSFQISLGVIFFCKYNSGQTWCIRHKELMVYLHKQ